MPAETRSLFGRVGIWSAVLLTHANKLPNQGTTASLEAENVLSDVRGRQSATHRAELL
jgi:hypothetical protein